MIFKYDKERKRPFLQSRNPETRRGARERERERAIETWEREREKANVNNRI